MIATAPSIGIDCPPLVGSTAMAAATLRDLGMPPAEIEAILEADDPRLVRRYLQLHLEWLEERLADQRSLLLNVGSVLAATPPIRSGIEKRRPTRRTYDRCDAGIVPAGKGETT